jgi:uncharacterized RDD family membrane protein YckC
MATPGHFDGLFIATPERVSFSYQLAGLGSRFMAQFLDLVILTVAMVVLSAGSSAIGLGGPTTALILIIGSFVLVNGYFVFFEGLWSGQTPGKRAARLRAVGDAGQPITFEQALMRNLVRNLDFLPAFYGVGIVALFANGRGKRLGDMAAGTVVVRERAGLSLSRLVAMAEWTLATPQPGAVAAASAAVPTADLNYIRQRALRDLDPTMRDFVTAYAARRGVLEAPYRLALAESARAGLARALPAVVAERGALAALDELAGYAVGPSPAALARAPDPALPPPLQQPPPVQPPR